MASSSSLSSLSLYGFCRCHQGALVVLLLLLLLQTRIVAFSGCFHISSRSSSGSRRRSHSRVGSRRDLYGLGATSSVTATATGTAVVAPRRRRSTTDLLTMRDRSCSYWFRAGDTVSVVEDVYHRKGTVNLRGRIGRVVETWEKCDVDPTCCCAEQVDTDMAVRVAFLEDNNDDNTAPPLPPPPPLPPRQGNGTEIETNVINDEKSEVFYYYFAEDELDKV